MIPSGVVVVLLIIAVVSLNVVMRGKRRPTGTRELMVRCSHGHAFMTRWTVTPEQPHLPPPVQLCPVCHHWSQVTPVIESELTEVERREAEKRWG